MGRGKFTKNCTIPCGATENRKESFSSFRRNHFSSFLEVKQELNLEYFLSFHPVFNMQKSTNSFNSQNNFQNTSHIVRLVLSIPKLYQLTPTVFAMKRLLPQIHSVQCCHCLHCTELISAFTEWLGKSSFPIVSLLYACIQPKINYQVTYYFKFQAIFQKSSTQYIG